MADNKASDQHAFDELRKEFLDFRWYYNYRISCTRIGAAEAFTSEELATWKKTIADMLDRLIYLNISVTDHVKLWCGIRELQEENNFFLLVRNRNVA